MRLKTISENIGKLLCVVYLDLNPIFYKQYRETILPISKDPVSLEKTQHGKDTVFHAQSNGINFFKIVCWDFF